MFFNLFRKAKGTAPTKVLQAEFNSPYDAFEALRQMSYHLQQVGMKPRVAGTGAEPELFLNDTTSFVFTTNDDYVADLYELNR